MTNLTYTYTIKEGKSVEEFISMVDIFLQSSENMETQRVPVEGEVHNALQARVKNGKLKQVIGMDKAIILRFLESFGEGHSVCIQIGDAKWMDKGIVMTVSMFVLWPLTVTSGVGIYRQKQLPAKIKKAADTYFETKALVWKEKGMAAKAAQCAGDALRNASDAAEQFVNSSAGQKIGCYIARNLWRVFR